MSSQENKCATLYKGVFWVIDDQIVSEKVICDECGSIILEKARGFLNQSKLDYEEFFVVIDEKSAEVNPNILKQSRFLKA